MKTLQTNQRKKELKLSAKHRNKFLKFSGFNINSQKIEMYEELIKIIVDYFHLFSLFRLIIFHMSITLSTA